MACEIRRLFRMNSPPTRLQFRLSRSAIRPDSVTQYYSGRNFQFSFSKEKIEKGEGKLKKYVDAYALWEPHPIQRTPLAKASLSFKNATTSLAVSRPSSIFDNLILDKTSLYANYLCLFFLSVGQGLETETIRGNVSGRWRDEKILSMFQFSGKLL